MWLLILVILWMLLLYLLFRFRYVKFSEKVIIRMDELINETYEKSNRNQETLNSKIDSKMDKLSKMVKGKMEKANQAKEEVEQMVSDITHQVKTPISNIRMYSDTIVNQDLSKEQEDEFLKIISNQVDKLEFLMNSLNKMSRLETSMIVLNKESSKMIECIEKAKQQVKSLAESKNIEIRITGEDCIISYDKKWTLEAICNILENAVKYTNENGQIVIHLEKLETFLKIDIIDNGIGIEQENINDIFKRFFRERRMINKDGVGIGLYLSKTIIEAQSGYIKVKSKVNEGSTFSIFLPV